MRWTYSDFSCEIECNYIDDAYGLRVPVRQFWETTPAEVLPAAGRIVVESPTEKSTSVSRSCYTLTERAAKAIPNF